MAVKFSIKKNRSPGINGSVLWKGSGILKRRTINFKELFWMREDSKIYVFILLLSI